MIPFHFGTGEAPLYGVYHPAKAGRRRKGVLILPPWGWEALRAHRTLHMLAHRLAGIGYDALRFDYSCSGDSAGDQRDASAHQWVDDAETALDELAAMSAASRVTVVGLRLGGLVAMQLARRRPREVDRLVLWEPARSGREFIDWVESRPMDENGAFPVTDQFSREIGAMGADALGGFGGSVLGIARDGLGMAAPAARALTEVTPPADSPICWVEDRDHGAGAVPVAVLDDILDWLDD